jgi:hypothetical protein
MLSTMQLYSWRPSSISKRSGRRSSGCWMPICCACVWFDRQHSAQSVSDMRSPARARAA